MTNKPSSGTRVKLVVMSVLLLASATIAQTAKPQPAPARWRPLIGEYVLENETVIVLENEGKLYALFKRSEVVPLREDSFSRDSRGKVTPSTDYTEINLWNLWIVNRSN